MDDTDVNRQNLFAYCSNNPVSREDSEGNIWNVVVGAVLGGTNALISTALFGNLSDNTKEERVAKLITSTIIGVAEGALISMFPTCGMAIGAVDSIVSGLIDKEA